MTKSEANALAEEHDQEAAVEDHRGNNGAAEWYRGTAAALRQLADRVVSTEVAALSIAAERDALRDERDREERVLRARWCLAFDYEDDAGYAWVHMRRKIAICHPDRAESALLAEAKGDM
jgi:hypothetical protein